jgi:hypothetical protein
MRTRLFMGLAAGAVSITAIACSSSPNPYATVSEYCTAYAKAICQISSTCQFDPTACETYQSGQCTAAAASTSTATRQYNSGNVQACLNALNAAYGNNPSSISSKQVANYTQVCSKVFVGSAAEGAACTSSFDCASSTDICASAPNRSAVCAQPTQRNAGEDCGDRGDQCPSNYYCSSTSVTCVASQTTGQPCGATDPCDGKDQCIGGTCALLSTIGNTCSVSTDCGQDQSGNQLFCDTYTSLEAPQPVCVNAYTFARASPDCLGIEGQGTNGTGSSSGGSSSGGTSSSGGSSSGSAGDGGEGGTSSGGDAASD